MALLRPHTPHHSQFSRYSPLVRPGRGTCRAFYCPACARCDCVVNENYDLSRCCGERALSREFLFSFRGPGRHLLCGLLNERSHVSFRRFVFNAQNDVSRWSFAASHALTTSSLRSNRQIASSSMRQTIRWGRIIGIASSSRTLQAVAIGRAFVGNVR
jgi:hypothetical protein